MTRHQCDCGHPPGDHTDGGCTADNTTCTGTTRPCHCPHYTWQGDQ